MFFKIGLVSYYDDGNILVVFYSDDLFAELRELVEAAVTCDGEDEEKSLTSLHV